MHGNALSDAGRVPDAVRRFGQACDAGIPVACTNLALTLLDPPADPDRALALLEGACRAGDPYGCGALGHELVQGRFAADAERGLALLWQACAQGAQAACADLQAMGLGPG
ncbi:MAG: hypothetical protein R3F59_05985 [Myxococcota bacterium]